MLRRFFSGGDGLNLWWDLIVCVFAVAFCVPLLVAAGRGVTKRDNAQSLSRESAQSGSVPIHYDSWIRTFRRGPLRGALGSNQKKILFEISVDSPPDLTSAPKLTTAPALSTIYGSTWFFYAISSAGTISESVGPGGVEGGCCQTIPKEDFKKLRRLIKNLPNDHRHLPPPGRRLVVQVAKRNGVLARVYDRDNMPERVLEIIRVAGLDIHAFVPNFKPDKIWPEGEFAEAGISPNAIGFFSPGGFLTYANGSRSPNGTATLAVSQDRSLTVKQAVYYSSVTEIVDSKTRKVVHQINHEPVGRHSIADYRAWFTPDGRYLLLLNNRPGIRIYDTRTWQKLERLPGMPSGEAAYYPSSDWAHGVAVWLEPGRGSALWCCGGSLEGAQVLPSRATEVWLWDAKAHRKLARLNLDGGIQDVSFSPDDSLVAVTSVARSNTGGRWTFHLRVWDTKSGKPVGELFPPWRSDAIGDPIWSKDGKYLLAPVIDGFALRYGVEIWGVRSHRYHGIFECCTNSDWDAPFSVLLQGHWLFKRTRLGTIYRWDVSAAINKIEAFESASTRPSENAITVPFATFVVQPAHSRSSRGSIEGSVVDPTGADVSGAIVKVRPGRHSVKTNKQGKFSVSRVVPGTYFLMVLSSGFRTYLARVKVAAGSVSRVRVTLRVGTTSGSVTVSPRPARH